MSVHLSGGSDGLALTIVDDGVGFDVNAAWGKGLGLISMSERLEAIGGTLEIRSTPGSRNPAGRQGAPPRCRAGREPGGLTRRTARTA